MTDNKSNELNNENLEQVTGGGYTRTFGSCRRCGSRVHVIIYDDYTEQYYCDACGYSQNP